MAKPELTAERLRELLRYDPGTGIFTWRMNRSGGTKAGDVAGSDDGQGYVSIRIDGRAYLAHRLVWLYVYGVWPERQIDHRYGIRNDNRLSELREATNKQNQHNQRKAQGSNKSGLLGVSYSRGKPRARIRVDGKQKHLGTFDTAELAQAAYLEAKAVLHPFQTLTGEP